MRTASQLDFKGVDRKGGGEDETMTKTRGGCREKKKGKKIVATLVNC